jgi:hypothetical protein
MMTVVDTQHTHTQHTKIDIKFVVQRKWVKSSEETFLDTLPPVIGASSLNLPLRNRGAVSQSHSVGFYVYFSPQAPLNNGESKRERGQVQRERLTRC